MSNRGGPGRAERARWLDRLKPRHAGEVAWCLFVADAENAVIGSVIIALGVPVFFAWRRWAVKAPDRP